MKCKSTVYFQTLILLN